MLAVHDTGQLLRFVQRSNVVDLVEGRASLSELGRYLELVTLLQSRAHHEAALDVLKTLSQAPAQLAVPPAGALQGLGRTGGSRGLEEKHIRHLRGSCLALDTKVFSTTVQEANNLHLCRRSHGFGRPSGRLGRGALPAGGVASGHQPHQAPREVPPPCPSRILRNSGLSGCQKPLQICTCTLCCDHRRQD